MKQADTEHPRRSKTKRTTLEGGSCNVLVWVPPAKYNCTPAFCLFAISHMRVSFNFVSSQIGIPGCFALEHVRVPECSYARMLTFSKVALLVSLHCRRIACPHVHSFPCLDFRILVVCRFVVPMSAISKFRKIACFVFSQRRSFTCASFRRFVVRILPILPFPCLAILHVRMISR